MEKLPPLPQLPMENKNISQIKTCAEGHSNNNKVPRKFEGFFKRPEPPVPVVRTKEYIEAELQAKCDAFAFRCEISHFLK